MFDNRISPETVYSFYEADMKNEMRNRKGIYAFPKNRGDVKEVLGDVLTEAFIKQPIIGNIRFSEKQGKLIHDLALQALQKVIREIDTRGILMSQLDSDLIFLNIVISLRQWNNTNEDSNDNSFWQFIFTQFGLNESDNIGNSHEYRIFKHVIKKSLRYHKRLFIDKGHKYYTTLLAHALSPQDRFFDLFEQVLSFYAKSLHYKYQKFDPAIYAFAEAMVDRFSDSGSSDQDLVYIRSIQSSSAIKSLFLSCHQYITGFIEYLINTIDVLVGGRSIQINSYLDELLVKWYEERSQEEKVDAKRRRSLEQSEVIVIDHIRIRPIYRLIRDQIILFIPAIRMGPESDGLPYLNVHGYGNGQNDQCIPLKYYGDYFCLTSDKYSLTVEELLTSFYDLSELRISIHQGQNLIYDSRDRLYRDAIVFSKDGYELTTRPNNERINIFAPRNSHVEVISDPAGDHFFRNIEGGEIHRIWFNDATQITVNGRTLFPMEIEVDDFTVSYLHPYSLNFRYFVDQTNCVVFADSPVLLIKPLAANNFTKQYRLMVNDDIVPWDTIENVDLERIAINLPDTNRHHHLRIIDNFSQRISYELYYVLLPELRIEFDGFYYHDNFEFNGHLILEKGDLRETHHYELDNSGEMILPYEAGELYVKIPILKCQLDSKSIHEIDQNVFWYEDLFDSIVKITLPRDYTGTLMLGGRAFTTSLLDLGNVLRAHNEFDERTLGLLIRQDGKSPIDIKLLDIVGQPKFLTKPLTVESNAFYWFLEDNFIGQNDSDFQTKIFQDDEIVFQGELPQKDHAFELPVKLSDGKYQITVEHAAGFFSNYRTLYHDQFIVGDKNQFLLHDMAISVTSAIINRTITENPENMIVSLKPERGIITDIKYLGIQALNGENIPYPCYVGRLQKLVHGNWRDYSWRDGFNDDVGSLKIEQVNPIKFWRISDYLISLRLYSDDGLYVHKGMQSITHYSPDQPQMASSSYIFPDYYEYIVFPESELETRFA